MRQCANRLVPIVVFLSGLSPATHQAWAAGSEPANAAGVASPAPAPPIGFAPASRSRELEAETKAQAVPTPENARKWLKTLTEEPHVAGTPADYKTAVFVRDRLREWGWKADLVPYEVLLNYPLGKPVLRLSRPLEKMLSVDEKPLATDKDSASTSAFGAFHGYGVSGTATGQVVYANYARPEDFTALEKMGITVRDKVVLARYGGNFRGLKVLNAQKLGARGILIYSDPGDDGYAKGDVYPEGPYRPGSAIQRGSVQFLSLGPGDPSTPQGPSVKDASRLPIAGDVGLAVGTTWESKTKLKREEYFATIPSLPISYDAAREIFRVLAGPPVPAGWQGGLPLAYHAGPGPAELMFSVQMDYKIRTIWNVIATIPGSVEPDRWVMVGNHRDAWVYGAVDPGSGTAATLEMCRALGAAVKNGWKPRRSLVYASWDAEEYGLVGSTEWAEQHASTVDGKVAILLNVDSAVSGRDMDMGGVPSLRDLALDAAGSVTDVRSGRPLREIWLEGKRSAWAAASPLSLDDKLWDDPTPASSAGRAGTGPRGFIPQLHPLGSGSDYTVFLDHLGVPSLDIGFSGRYGVYHSIYDDFNWMEKFGDPEFLTHTMAARLYTVLMMRAAAADVLPLRFGAYGEALRDHVDELRLIEARRARARPEKAGQAGAHSHDSNGPIETLPTLVAAVKAFLDRAHDLDRTLDRLTARDGVSGETLARVNDSLTRVERAFLLPEGLPGRPWFRHSVYAPGVTTGYGAWPLPEVRQVIEEHQSDHDRHALEKAIARTAAVIGKASDALKAVQEAASGPGSDHEAPR